MARKIEDRWAGKGIKMARKNGPLELIHCTNRRTSHSDFVLYRYTFVIMSILNILTVPTYISGTNLMPRHTQIVTARWRG